MVKSSPGRLSRARSDGVWAVAVGLFLASWAVAAISGFMTAWCLSEQTVGPGAVAEVTFLNVRTSLSPNACLFLLLFSASAIGSLVHATLSFVTYVGNNSFRRSWVAWYLLRVFTGVGLSLIVYLVMRAGLLAGTGAPQNTNLFGVAAIGSLTGLFSKQAVDKLREVFDVTFSVGFGYGDSQRGDKVLDGSPSTTSPTGSASNETADT
jgi:hypothetical protein